MSKPKLIVSTTVGSVSAALFENRTEKGYVYHQAKIVTRYKDGDGEYQDSSSFGELELFAVEELAKKLREAIGKRKERLRRDKAKEKARPQPVDDPGPPGRQGEAGHIDVEADPF